MTALNSLEPSPNVLEILHYLIAKQWQVSLVKKSYTGILDREIRALLDVSKRQFASFDLDLLFPILWNELERGWHRDSPYLVSAAGWDPMRRYMLMVKDFEIIGPTNMIFRYIRNPNMMLLVKRSGGDIVRVRSELSDGIPLLHVELPVSSKAHDILRTYWNEYTFADDVPVKFPSITYSPRERLTGAAKDQQNAKQKDFQDAVDEDLTLTSRRDALSGFLWGAGCRDERQAKDGVRGVHETLALLRLLLDRMPEESELLYSYSSSNLLFEEPSGSDGISASGGCFVYIGSAGFTGNNAWWQYYLLSSVAIAKLQSVQRFFNQHFERHFALQAATASIMTRNWAHHYDSHIRPRAQLEDVRRRLRSLRCFGPGGAIRCLGRGGAGTRDCGEACDLYETVALLRGRLDNYVSAKAAFIAEVTSEPLTTTKRAMFYRDVVVPMAQNTLFMDNIAANEGLGYTRRIPDEKDTSLKFRASLRLRAFRVSSASQVEGPLDTTVEEFQALFSCTPGQQPIYTYPTDGYPYDNRCNASASVVHPHSSDLTYPEHLELVSVSARLEGEGFPVQAAMRDPDVEIELPGLLGEQAFYGFVENLIRNAAKHTRPAELELRMCLSEPADERRSRDYYQLDVWDTVTDPAAPVCLKVDEEDRTTLIEAIRAYLKSDLLAPSLQVKPQAWGIAEMKISASMLAGSADWDRLQQVLVARSAWETSDGVLSDDTQPPKPDARRRLVYRLHLMKSRRICVVSSIPLGAQRRETLERQGIFVFSDLGRLEGFFESSSVGSSMAMQSPACFDFALIEDETEADPGEWAQRLVLLKPYLPARMLISTDRRESLEPSLVPAAIIDNLSQFFEKDLLEGDPLKLYDSVWRRWLARWPADKVSLCIGLDQQNLKEVPTATWDEVSKSFNADAPNVSLQVRSHHEGKVSIEALRLQGHPVIYDRHSTLGRPATFNYDGSAFYEPFDKGNPDFQLLFSPRLERSKGAIRSVSPSPYLLAEAGLARVLIVDERVAERTYERIGGRMIEQRHGLFRGLAAGRAGIWIVTHFNIDADPSPIHRQVELLDRENNYPSLRAEVTSSKDGLTLSFGGVLAPNGAEDQSRFFDIAIIHQGLLETFIKSASERQEFLSSLAKCIPVVVVSSGRGIPTDVQMNRKVKFLPFSLVERYLLGGSIAKIGLTSLCMKLTRRPI